MSAESKPLAMSDLASLLLPCPFCGGDEPRLTTNTHAGMSWVACLNCGLEAPSETGVSAEDAVTYWNRRSPPIKAGDAVPVAMVADRLAAWFNSLPDGGMGKEHFDALLSIAASPQPESYGVRAAVIEECAKVADKVAKSIRAAGDLAPTDAARLTAQSIASLIRELNEQEPTP